MKRVFDMDLYIKDSMALGVTVEEIEEDHLWAKECEGQRVYEDLNMYGEVCDYLTCVGRDSNNYRVMREWVKEYA